MTEEVRYNYTGYRVYFDKKGKVHRYKEINYLEMKKNTTTSIGRR